MFDRPPSRAQLNPVFGGNRCGHEPVEDDHQSHLKESRRGGTSVGSDANAAVRWIDNEAAPRQIFPRSTQ